MDAPTLFVCFEGTANTLRPITTQVGVFFEACVAVDLTDPSVAADAKATAHKIDFDGCGVTHGLAGTIWAYGLATHCDAVCARVEELLAHGPLRVVCLGLSRGGIGALMLAKRFAQRFRADPPGIELHLCLFDPVPGNLVSTVRHLDVFRTTTAASCDDVSECACLRRVLALYPHEPLPDFAFHAPILPRYPKACDVEEDATLGCHQAALYPPRAGAPDAACLCSFVRIHDFLRDAGVAFRVPPLVVPDPSLDVNAWTRDDSDDDTPPLGGYLRAANAATAFRLFEESKLAAAREKCVRHLKAAMLAPPSPTRRIAHGPHGGARVAIERCRAEDATAANRHHLQLTRGRRPDDADCSAKLLLRILRDE